MSTTVQEPEAEDTEERRVRDWRFSQFVRIGLSDLDATYLADARVDWHRADRLLRLGCPPERVADILL